MPNVGAGFPADSISSCQSEVTIAGQVDKNDPLIESLVLLVLGDRRPEESRIQGEVVIILRQNQRLLKVARQRLSMP